MPLTTCHEITIFAITLNPQADPKAKAVAGWGGTEIPFIRNSPLFATTCLLEIDL